MIEPGWKVFDAAGEEIGHGARGAPATRTPTSSTGCTIKQGASEQDQLRARPSTSRQIREGEVHLSLTRRDRDLETFTEPAPRSRSPEVDVVPAAGVVVTGRTLSDELAFAPALEQAARSCARGLAARARRALPRADRAARPAAERVRHRRRRRRAAARARRPVHGVPIPIKDLNETAGLRTTYSCKRVRRLRAGDRRRGRAADPRRRLRDHRQDEHAGVRLDRDDGVGAERRLPQPVGHRRARRAARAAAPPRRSQPGSRRSRTAATAAARSASPRRAAASSGSSRRAGASRRRRTARARSASARPGPIARTVRDAAALLDVMTRLRAGRLLRRARAGAAVPRGGRRGARPAADRGDDGAAGRRAGRSGLRRRRARRSRAADRARPRRRRGDAAVAERRRRSSTSPASGRSGRRSSGVDDLSLLEPLNRMLAENARATPSPECGGRGDAAAGADAADRRVLERRRRRRHADARAAAGPDRLDVGRRGRRPAGRVRSGSGSGRRSRRSSTSRASRRCRCRSTGATTACRSACR